MGWLGTWKYRTLLKYGTTKPSSSLSGFSLLVDFSHPRLHAENTSGRPNMAFTLADGTTTCSFGSLKYVGDGAVHYIPAGSWSSATSKITSTAHGLKSGYTVSLGSVVPGGLSAGEFYVVNPTTNDFQVASTYGGSPITLTNSGSFGSTDIRNPWDRFRGRVKVNPSSTAATGDAYLYAYIDKTQTDQESKSGAVDANTKAYWALEEGPDNTSGQIKDWTGTFNATSFNTPTQNVNGKVSNGINFDGTDDYIRLGQDIWTYGATFTTSMWAKIPYQSSGARGLIGQGGSDTNPTGGVAPVGYVPQLYLDDPAQYGDAHARLVSTPYWCGVTSARLDNNGASYIDDNAWHKIDLTWDSLPGDYKLYIDGSLVSSFSGASTSSYSSAYFWWLGTAETNGWPKGAASTNWSFFNGTLDEIRFDSSARSAAWITYGYANDNNPSNTITNDQNEETSGSITATATLTAGTHSISASATFAAGTKTATAAITAPPRTFASSATFTQPVWTASAAITAPPRTFAGSATFASTYTASGTLTAPPRTFAGSALYEVYTASMAATSGTHTFAGSATFVSSGSSGTAALSSHTTFASSGTFTKPVYTGSSVLTAGTHSLSASGSTLSRTATAVLVSHSTSSATGTFTKPTYHGTMAVVNPHATFSGSALGYPLYTATAAINNPHATVTIVGTFTKPTWTAAGTFQSHTTISAAANTGTPTYTASAAVVSHSTSVSLAQFTKPSFTATGDFTTHASESASATLSFHTYTATSALSTHAIAIATTHVGAPQYTGAASFISFTIFDATALSFPIRTADATNLTTHQSIDIVGTFRPRETADASVTVHTAAAGFGQFTAPTYHGVAAFTSNYSFQCSAQQTFPSRTATATFTTHHSIAGTGQISYPTYTASAIITVTSPIALAGQAFVLPPQYHGALAAILSPVSYTASASFTKPSYVAASILTAAHSAFSGLGQIVNPTWTGHGDFSVHAALSSIAVYLDKIRHRRQIINTHGRQVINRGPQRPTLNLQ